MKNLLPLLLLPLFVISSRAQFTAGRVVVLRCGSTSSGGNSGFLAEYLPSTASQASPIYEVTLPNSGATDSGSSIVFGNNSAFNHGLSLSADGAFVVIGGYANTFTTVDTTSGANSPRVIATVKYDGSYARPISSSSIFSGATFRCATSDGFGNFWGINAATVSYFGSGTPGTIQGVAGRTIAVANGNLCYTIGASVRAYPGLPTTSSSGAVLITSHLGSPSSTGFGVPQNPVAGSLAYVADVTAGVVGRYNYDGSSWNWQYDIALPSSDKPQYMAVDYSGSTPVIFATTAVTTANRLYGISDPGPAAVNATITLLATAPANNLFRGVVISPRQPAAPVFTTPPTGATNNYGSTVTLGPVAATGANPNAWTWKKGSTTLTDGPTGSGSTISGSTTPTLTIQNITGLDAGNYFAIAANNGGVTSSSAATLGLSGSSITTQLVSRTNVAGTTATFHVVSGGPQPLSYQWYHGLDLLGNGVTGSGSTISGSSSDTLSISNVHDDDAGNYTVTVTDGNSAQSSSTATLTVVDPPAFTLQPTNQTKAAGGTASFAVDATGGSLSYRWYQGVTPLNNGPTGSGSTISGAFTPTLTITGVQDGDVGTYSATATNLAGNATSDPATLSVGHAPAITGAPSNRTNAPGSTATFTAAASGSPTLTYTWKHNGTTLVNDGVHIFGADTASLTVAGVQIDDARLYSVTINNAFGNAAASALLFFIAEPPQPQTVPNQLIYEPFNYPQGPYPAAGFYSWENVITIYNQASGQPAFWYNASGGLNSAVQGNDFINYNNANRVPPGQYPWPGVDCNSTNLWYFSSAPNNNHLKFGGANQNNGAVYFSMLFHADQGSPLSQGTFDTIGGFTSGDSVSGGANINTWNYKLCAQVDSGGDGYYLGVFKGNNETINATSVNGQWVTSKHLARGQLHYLVGCYKFLSGTNLVGGSLTNDDIVSLWIDPDRSTFGAAETSLPAPDAGGMLTNWFQNNIISEFGLRGALAPASKRVSDLRIGTTWASVTKPYYPVLKMTTTGSDATLTWPLKDTPFDNASFAYHGYSLQQSPDLLTWTDLPPPYNVDATGTNNSSTIPIDSIQFFRLIDPPR